MDPAQSHQIPLILELEQLVLICCRACIRGGCLFWDNQRCNCQLVSRLEGNKLKVLD